MTLTQQSGPFTENVRPVGHVSALSVVKQPEDATEGLPCSVWSLVSMLVPLEEAVV